MLLLALDNLILLIDDSIKHVAGEALVIFYIEVTTWRIIFLILVDGPDWYTKPGHDTSVDKKPQFEVLASSLVLKF